MDHRPFKIVIDLRVVLDETCLMSPRIQTINSWFKSGNLQYCKVISLQLIKINGVKKNHSGQVGENNLKTNKQTNKRVVT